MQEHAAFAEQLQHGLVDHVDIPSVGCRVARRGDPFPHDGSELIGSHAGVRCHNEIVDCRHAAGMHSLEVSFQQGGKRLLGLPFGVLRCKRPNAVSCEEQLEIRRLLGPQVAVIVEGGDTLCGRHVVLRSFLRDLRNERDDGLFGGRVVPGRQWIVLLLNDTMGAEQ